MSRVPPPDHHRANHEIEADDAATALDRRGPTSPTVNRGMGRSHLIRRALRHPREALGLAEGRRVRLFVVGLAALPAGPRRFVIGTLDGVARRAVRRGGEHPIAAPIRLIALHAAGRDREAATEGARLAAITGPLTRRRLLGAALAIGDVALADEIQRDAPDPDPDLRTIAMLGEIDVAAGRYAAAVAHLERAASGGHGLSSWQRRMLGRARGELVVLEPGWRPPVGSRTRLADRVPGRILHLLTNSLPYVQAGYTVRAQQVALAQLASGLDPHLATRAGFPGSVGVANARLREEVDGVPYHRLRPDLDPGVGPDAMATAMARAAGDLIRELRPAVLHPATNHLNAQVALALRDQFDLPVVYEVRGFLEETWLTRTGPGAAESDRYRGARAVETASMRAADAIVTLSEAMRQEILDRGEIAADSVVVIPNGVDVARFTPGPRDERLAASLGIAAGETVVGYISGLMAYEGIDYLIRAVALLRDRGRTVRLLIVGDGEARASLVATAKEEGLDDSTVIFTGRVPYRDIVRYYRTIDIFVVPRTNDRVSRLVTPLKPFEAMAMAKALLVSGVDALLEIIPDDRTGRSFTPEDPTSLADALEPLLDDPLLRQELGTAARAWVTEHRTWDRVGRQYLELYQRLGVA
jgi:glycosyltransferase involved in cell wall biosynthesis